MALTLDDILQAPQDEAALRDHLIAQGHIPAPPVPATLGAITPRDRALMVGATAQPTVPPARVAPLTPPEVTAATATPPAGIVAPMVRPTLPRPSIAPTMEPVPAKRPPKAGPGAFPALSPVTSADIASGLNVRPNIPATSLLTEAAPPVPAGAPAAAEPAAALAGPGPPITLTKPTRVESEAAGRAEYLAGRPTVTADPGKDPLEYAKQKRAQDVYDQQHPLGSAVSAMPGWKGKLLHGAGLVGNIAGNLVVPGVMATTPGTMGNRALEIARLGRDIPRLEEAGSKLSTEASTRATQELQRQNIESEIQHREQAQLEKDSQGNITGWRDQNGALRGLDDPETPKGIKDIAEATLTKPTYEHDAVSGNVVAITRDKDGNIKSDVVYKGTPQQKVDVKSLVSPDGKPHDYVIDMQPNSPTFGQRLKDLGQSKVESLAHELAAQKAGEEWVLGFDAQRHQWLVPKAVADSMGLTHQGKAGNALKDAQQNATTLNDMGAKVGNLANGGAGLPAEVKALDQGAYERGLITVALHGTKDDLRSIAAMGMMNALSRAYVSDIFSLREAALALPKQLTGGSRVSEIQAKALWSTLPGSAGSSADAMRDLRRFDENLARMWEKVPRMEGIDRERPFGETAGTMGGGAMTAGGAGGGAAPPKGGGAAPAATPPAGGGGEGGPAPGESFADWKKRQKKP